MPACGIYSGARGVEAFVGRLEPAAGSSSSSQSLEHPVQLKRTTDDEMQASAPSGQVRVGKPSGVKTGLHWLLVPREKGGYNLQPVSGWFDFAKPKVGLATPSISCARPLVISSGEAELRREAKERQELADRQTGMFDRRAARIGNWKVKSGKAIAAMDQLVPDEGDAIWQGKKDKVFQPDDERLNDEMGLRKQRKKKAKALQKEAGAVNNAEDIEDVPETANALLSLKREKGEAGWDNDDDDLFSDDEQEACEFDGNLENPDPQEIEAGLSADEEDGADDDEKDLLTSHGKQLESLIDNVDEQFESHLRPEDSGSEDEEQKRYVDDRPVKKQKIEASSSPAPVIGTQGSSSSSRAAPAPVNVGQTSALLPGTDQKQTRESEDPLKQSAINFLRQNGGECSLKDMSRVLNLSKLKKSGQTEEYQRIIEMLKEVSTINKTQLVLNDQYREVSDQKVTPHLPFPSASPSPPAPEPSASPPPASGTLKKPKAKVKALAHGERTDRFELMVSNFVSALRKKGFKSRLQAAEYLEEKTKGKKGLSELEVREILLRFCRESNLK